MNLRDILVFLDASSASDERLRLATSLARKHRGFLSAAFLHDERAAKFSPGFSVPRLGLMSGAPVPTVDEIPQQVVFADNAERRFRDCQRSLGGIGEWYPLDRGDMTQLVALSRAAGLVIIGQANPNVRHGLTWRPEEVVLACGRPVMVVPYIGSYPEVGRRILVAWDGSREAVRALNDALPIMCAAEAVTVMTVRHHSKDSEGDHQSINRIIRHLARHNVEAHAEEPLRGDNAVADALLSRAADFSVDMIVAGAYHHSRLRESLIGGVSRGLFQHMTVPVLMSH